MAAAPESKSPTPRRDAAATRARILAAAQAAFAETGYSQAGMRQIAREARVDPALLVRYFGSKAALFEAALADTIPDLRQLEMPADFGSLLAGEVLGGLLDLRAQSMILLAIGSAEAREICARVLRTSVIEPMAARIGTPDAQVRAIRLVMIATGYTLFTSQVPLIGAAEAEASGTAAWLEALVREIFAPPPQGE